MTSIAELAVGSAGVVVVLGLALLAHLGAHWLE